MDGWSRDKRRVIISQLAVGWCCAWRICAFSGVGGGRTCDERCLTTRFNTQNREMETKAAGLTSAHSAEYVLSAVAMLLAGLLASEHGASTIVRGGQEEAHRALKTARKASDSSSRAHEDIMEFSNQAQDKLYSSGVNSAPQVNCHILDHVPL
jgi:hypothetical protein